MNSGVLAPVRAGSPAADLTADEAWLQAMPNVQVAAANARAGSGVIADAAAVGIAEAARAERIGLAAIALGARETDNPVVVSLVKALTAEPAQLDATRLDVLLDPAHADADVDHDLIRHRATS